MYGSSDRSSLANSKAARLQPRLCRSLLRKYAKNSKGKWSRYRILPDHPAECEEERPVFYSVKIQPVAPRSERESAEETTFVSEERAVKIVDALCMLCIRQFNKSVHRIWKGDQPSRCRYTSDVWSSVSACQGSFDRMRQNCSGSGMAC